MPTILTNDLDFKRRTAKLPLVGLLDTVKSDQSQIWTIVSDSTGVQDSTTRWPFLVATAQATELASKAKRLEFRQLRGTAEPTIFEYYKPILLSAGAGPRGIQFSSGTPRSRFISTNNVIARTGEDIEILIAFDPLNNSPAAFAAIGGQPGAGAVAASSPSSRGPYITQETSGNYRLNWNENGTGTAGSFADGAGRWAEWTAAQLGVVPGTPVIVKFTLDADNGSGGWTAKAYPMTYSSYFSSSSVSNPEVQVWGTGLAPTTTSVSPTAAVTTVNKSVANIEIGARGDVTSPFYGTVYKLQIHDGIDGPLIHSPNIDDFTRSTPTATSVMVGSSTLYVYNGAAAGKNFSWFAGTAAPVDALRPSRIFIPGSALTTISTGHNEALLFGLDIKTAIETFITTTTLRSPCQALHMIKQNPELDLTSTPSAQYATAKLHGQRQAQMANVVAMKGGVVSDVYTAFETHPDWNPAGNRLMSSTDPAVHPSAPDGYTLEASIVAVDFGLVIPFI